MTIGSCCCGNCPCWPALHVDHTRSQKTKSASSTKVSAVVVGCWGESHEGLLVCRRMSKSLAERLEQPVITKPFMNVLQKLVNNLSNITTLTCSAASDATQTLRECIFLVICWVVMLSWNYRNDDDEANSEWWWSWGALRGFLYGSMSTFEFWRFIQSSVWWEFDRPPVVELVTRLLIM